MKTKWSSLLLCLCSLLLIFGLVACEVTNTSSTTVGTNTTSTTEETKVSAEEQKLDEEVFPKDKVVDVKITIDEDEFQDMLDNASNEEIKTASVDYNGHHFDNVGIRTKGNLSLRSVVQMTDSDRYSFKLSFDEFVNQTLGGISKINLNNNYSDATSMREFLTYELAETMGLPTPKHSFVNIYINDELWGFYLAVEQIGDAYLERNFGNSYGALYKGEMTGSGSDLLWIDDNPDSYTGLVLKSDTTNGDILIDMINELNNGSDYEKYIDVEEALKYIALNVVTNNTDSYIGGNKQNYYLYEDDGIFSVLPWDYNMAFSGMAGGGMGGGFGGQRPGAGAKTDTDASNTAVPDNATGDSKVDQGDAVGDNNKAAGGAMVAPDNAAGDTAVDQGNAPNGAPTPPDQATGDGQTPPEIPDGFDPKAANGGGLSKTNLLIDEPTQGAVAERPLVAKLLEVDEYKEMYHNIIKQAVEGFLENDTFTAKVEELSNMISSYVKADPSAFYTYEEYEQGVTQLIATNASQVENISQQLDGTIASSGDGSGSGGGMGGGGGMRGGARGLAAQGADATGQAPQGVPATQGADATGQAPQGVPAAQGADATGQAPQGDQAAQGADATGQASQGDPAMQGADTTGQAPQGVPATQGADATGLAPQGGFGGGRGQGDRPMDMGNGGGQWGGFGGDPSVQQQDNSNNIITAGISLLILILSCLFVAFYKRKRL
ncbi:CotH kinase family protein [Paenibacillus anaericanus]|uniref:CotH kinase family protein n=1 Tax=Paenibacillus anaericanus TaxID=170367 RepID=UPI001477165A|nr:CotH kinase family protein [Paenibacillus anaericanus]